MKVLQNELGEARLLNSNRQLATKTRRLRLSNQSYAAVISATCGHGQCCPNRLRKRLLVKPTEFVRNMVCSWTASIGAAKNKVVLVTSPAFVSRKRPRAFIEVVE
jgi:hypothetical protein